MLQGFEEVKAKLKREGVCIASTEKLIKDSGVATAEAYDETVRVLLQTPRARGRWRFSACLNSIDFYCCAASNVASYSTRLATHSSSNPSSNPDRQTHGKTDGRADRRKYGRMDRPTSRHIEG